MFRLVALSGGLHALLPDILRGAFAGSQCVEHEENRKAGQNLGAEISKLGQKPQLLLARSGSFREGQDKAQPLGLGEHSLCRRTKACQMTRD